MCPPKAVVIAYIYKFIMRYFITITDLCSIFRSRLLGFLCCFMLLQASASVIPAEINHYQKAIEIYQHIKHKDKTLLVFDIDDTLVTTKSYLGGPAFWDWQVNLLKGKEHSPYLLAHDIESLSDIEAFLLSKSEMIPTESTLKAFLDLASHNQSDILLLTARTPDMLKLTLTHLHQKAFYLPDGHWILDENAVKLNDKYARSELFCCPHFKYQALYKSGVLFVSGQDKGTALHCLLNRADKPIENILYFDDSKENVINMQHAFEHNKHILMRTFLYTYERAKEELFKKHKSLRMRAYQKWLQLKGTYRLYREKHRVKHFLCQAK